MQFLHFPVERDCRQEYAVFAWAVPARFSATLGSCYASSGQFDLQVIRKWMCGFMKLVWLDAFVAVAQRESFTDAAKTIGKDQGSVSRYVNQLQKWLGKTLIESYPPVKLTPEGKAFLPIARQVVALLTDARNVAPLPTAPIDPLSIGVS